MQNNASQGQVQIDIAGLIILQIKQVDLYIHIIDSHLHNITKAIKFKTSLKKYRVKLKERADAIISSDMDILIEIGKELLEVDKKYRDYFVAILIPEWIRLEPYNKDEIYSTFNLK